MFSVVTGANGIGKTTLLNTIVSGYLEYDQKDKKVGINECTDNFELLQLNIGKTISASSQSSRSLKAFEVWTQEYISKLKSYCENRYKNLNVEENQEFEAIFKLIEPKIVNEGIDKLIKDFKQKSLFDFDTIPKLFLEYLKQNGVILFLQFTIGLHK
jgi:ABC-type multidrug transport system ATPase subunit